MNEVEYRNGGQRLIGDFLLSGPSGSTVLDAAISRPLVGSEHSFTFHTTSMSF